MNAAENTKDERTEYRGNRRSCALRHGHVINLSSDFLNVTHDLRRNSETIISTNDEMLPLKIKKQQAII